MLGNLDNRENCTEQIRELTRLDMFMTRYALAYAMEQLDLLQLNRLREACEITVRELPKADERAAALMRERFGN